MTRAAKGRNLWALVLGLAAGLLVAALPAPVIASAEAPSYAKTRVWGFEVQNPAGVGAERGLNPTGTGAYGARYDELAAGYPLVPGGTGPAHRAANAERLRIQLTAEEIAQGHAFEKHVLQQGEFRGLGIRTRAQYQRHVENVLSNPTGARYYRDGRVAVLHEPSGTVVIRNPVSGESTAFQPANWADYLATRLPGRTTPYP